MIRYEIRAATRRDHDDLLHLAKFLDSVNLPHDSTAVTELLDMSERSFSANLGDPRRREYVLYECGSSRKSEHDNPASPDISPLPVLRIRGREDGV